MHASILLGLLLALILPFARPLQIPSVLNLTNVTATSGISLDGSMSGKKALPVAVTESSTSASEVPGPITWFDKGRVDRNLCGSSSFVSHPSISSPYATDCIALANATAKQPGYFVARLFTDASTPLAVIGLGTCTFGIRPASIADLEEWHWVVGNKDVQELLEETVRTHSFAPETFAGDGQEAPVSHVGASGRMTCELRGSKMEVVWSVYDAHQEAVGFVEVPVPDSNSASAQHAEDLFAIFAILFLLAIWIFLF